MTTLHCMVSVPRQFTTGMLWNACKNKRQTKHTNLLPTPDNISLYKITPWSKEEFDDWEAVILKQLRV
ncbi:uncharacterized protein N7479_007027 [Penicillium vulpinum]|uniref:uncharacterized protein n=1 Tax=Penicillium vulpinum TaxID=29845 RepID=UPI0025466334|nr:uncharacterized protein N7479_007027 [Penicillium vulpinum]KAJ5959877.1 hypothetical protein N7479_007027 [Penicillium vulpinum]